MAAAAAALGGMAVIERKRGALFRRVEASQPHGRVSRRTATRTHSMQFLTLHHIHPASRHTLTQG